MAKVIVSFNSPFNQIFRITDNNGKEKRIEIKGNASHLIGVTGAVLPIGTYGQTEITQAEWDAIVEKYGNMKIFKRRFIFVSESAESAKAQEIDHAETRHGAEPIDVSETTTEPEDEGPKKKTTKKKATK